MHPLRTLDPMLSPLSMRSAWWHLKEMMKIEDVIDQHIGMTNDKCGMIGIHTDDAEGTLDEF